MKKRLRKVTKKNTIEARELNLVAMSVHEDLPNRVIDHGCIRHYVGIGWVNEGEATKEDYKKYPTVTRKGEK